MFVEHTQAHACHPAAASAACSHSQCDNQPAAERGAQHLHGNLVVGGVRQVPCHALREVALSKPAGECVGVRCVVVGCWRWHQEGVGPVRVLLRTQMPLLVFRLTRSPAPSSCSGS